MAMSQEQIKLERKIMKHRNRNAAYHFQLPAYTQMIRSLNAAPLLDSNMVSLLEALMDLLGRVADFNGYRPPDLDEFDLRELGVGFSFGCNYCNQKGFNARKMLDHVMTDDHSQLPNNNRKKIDRFKRQAHDSYKTFLLRKHEIMLKNKLLPEVLDRMVDFYLMTKSFLKMTTRYLTSLDKLERVPSTIVACGVIDLLDMIDLLVTRARCIESVPEFTTIMHQLTTGDVKFISKGKLFDQVQAALEHATVTSGLKAPYAPPVVQQNIFSLPQMFPNQASQLQPGFLVGPPLMTNMPRPTIPPFTSGPAIRMMPPPHPIPMMGASMVPVGVNMQVINVNSQQQNHYQQQHIQQLQFQQQQHQLLFNPSMVRMVSQQQLVQQQQQHTVHQQQPLPPAARPQPPTSPSRVDVQHSLRLPPLNQSGPADRPVLNDLLVRFLNHPDVDSLIENGNVLVNFDKSSVIPSEIVCALKTIAPNVTVECFGAKVSGVGYEEDNVNLYVDDAKHPKTPESVKDLFETLKNFFLINNDDWVIQNIIEADIRTYLTVKNTCENVCCRITFASELYCYNSRLIRYYMKTFPECQKLCYFVQEFIKLIDLDFNRYVIIVLVLFYMQKRDYLPTVAQLQSRMPEEILSGHWLINFVPHKPGDFKLKPSEADFGSYAVDFFLFYGKQFSFQESVVCPQIGLALNRADFLAENMWRMPLKRYRAYFEECQSAGSNDGDKDFAQFELTPMCVQDPLELTGNIARQVSSDDTGKFVQMCKKAYEFHLNNK